MKLITIVTTAVFSLLLYLQMCIASLRENYQIGINKIQLFQPSIIILFMIIICFIPVKNIKIFNSISKFMKLAFIVCGILFIFSIIINFSPQINHWSFPHERALVQTLRTSLFHPQFSGHSTGILFQNIFLLSVLAFALLLKRKHRKT